MFDQKVIDRFNSKYSKQPDTGCWEWTAGLDRYGYGIFTVAGFKFAHRISYEIHNGVEPAGKLVCHTCDNRKCVNPAHLYLGTNKDNMQDMVKKNRSTKGRPKSEEHNLKNSLAHKGRKYSDEHRQKISEGLKRRYSENKETA
jgi:hypothetical protein